MPGLRCTWWLASLLVVSSSAAVPAADPSGVQFFEQKIRPVLVKHCYQCHSAEAKKLRGGFLLDTREGIRKGGDTGPALVPGKPTESLLLKALRHDDLAMPPDEKLPDEIVADFERWIKLGAPDPREGKATTVRTSIDIEKGRKFWAFQPPRHHPIPAVKHAAWPAGDIDRFVLHALEAKNLRPVRDADRVTLIRRLAIDLTGLPPTPAEIDAFAADASPDAYEKLVDRLLASPAFGERWGRHWLDLARYGDSNGKDENLTFHEAFRYRDYVIDAFNRDKPYDQFIVEQLAGDLLPASTQAEKDEHLTATGFLVVGPKVLADRDFLKRRMDVVDEQIDTIGKTFFGMSLGCARCHDHKFDPITSSDYYALGGILASTRTLDGIKLGNAVVSGWMLRPLGAEGEPRLAAYREHQKKLAAMADQIKKAEAELKQHEDKATMRAPGKFIGITVDDKEATLVGYWKPSQFSRPYVGDGYIHDDKSGKGEKSVTFTPILPKDGVYEVLVSYTASSNRSTKTPVIVRSEEGEKTTHINQQEAPKIDGLFRSVGKYRFKAGKSGSVTISNKDTTDYVIVDAVRFVPTGALEKDAEMAMGVPEEVRQKLADAQSRLKKLKDDERALKASSPAPPPLVMAVKDESKIEDLRINIRGNPHQLGDQVPRGFIHVMMPQRTEPVSLPATQSGRLELARWIASRDHPLTARVMVNRVWRHLFGEGLVRTLDDFGAQGQQPTHPELLDELAVRFVEDGWSVKRLVRAIVLSRTYRLACVNDPVAAKVDPENRLFWRAQRRRVEAEVIRDSMLMVSGQLNRSMGGPVVAHLGERAIDNDSKGGVPTDTNFRRSVYLPIIRNDLPQLFEVFDFADPEVTTGKRDSTTVSTQALYLMNSPFVMEQARLAASRLLAMSGEDAARVNELYRCALGRSPDAEECQRALQFVAECRKGFTENAKTKGKESISPDIEAWSALCLAMFGCTEFRFVE